MSFTPAQNGFNTSLLGAEDWYRFKNIPVRNPTLYRKQINGPDDDDGNPTNNPTTSNRTAIIFIIISAIIFIAIVAVYDVIRNIINNYYAERALRDPKSTNTLQEIDNTLIGNYQGLIASIIFAVFSIIVAVILVYVLLKFLKKYK